MDKFVVQLNLEHVRDARAVFNEASRKFTEDISAAMTRLIHEAAAQMMSPQDVARHSGFTTAQIKSRMKALDLNPTKGKRLLSQHAAKVLATNAALLGVDVTAMDLMSPLAYLPAGDVTAFLETQVKPDIEEMLSSDPKERIEIALREEWDKMRGQHYTGENLSRLISNMADAVLGL